MKPRKPPAVCPPCTAEADRWFDTTPQGLFVGLGFVMQASAAYDFTVRGMADRRRIRFERWRDTVRRQRDLIFRACRAGGHVNAAVLPARRPVEVVQLDLFDAA